MCDSCKELQETVDKWRPIIDAVQKLLKASSGYGVKSITIQVKELIEIANKQLGRL